jgi:hypothetical protein
MKILCWSKRNLNNLNNCMAKKDWIIQMHGKCVGEVVLRELRLCAAPRLGHWLHIELEDGAALYARPVETTTARTAQGTTLTSRASHHGGPWARNIEGQRVVKVEQYSLRLCASQRLSPWWVVVFENGAPYYVRPVDITTARTADGAIFTETKQARRQRQKYGRDGVGCRYSGAALRE